METPNTAVLRGHPDLFEHYSFEKELMRGSSRQPSTDYRKKLEYLCCLAQARDTFNVALRNFPSFEDNPIQAFPLLLKAYEWRERAKNISQERSRPIQAYWFVKVTTPQDHIEMHLVQSISLMNPEDREAKREYALKLCAGHDVSWDDLEDAVDSDDSDESDDSEYSRTRKIGQEVGCFNIMTRDNDTVRMLMISTMECKECTDMRREDIARMMHAENLAQHHGWPLKRIFGRKALIDLGLIFCETCYELVEEVNASFTMRD